MLAKSPCIYPMTKLLIKMLVHTSAPPPRDHCSGLMYSVYYESKIAIKFFYIIPYLYSIESLYTGLH